MACCCGFRSDEGQGVDDDADDAYTGDVPTDMGISVTSSEAVKREQEALMSARGRASFGGLGIGSPRSSVDASAGADDGVQRRNHHTRVHARASIIQGIFGGITHGLLGFPQNGTAPLPHQKRASLFVTPGMAGSSHHETIDPGGRPMSGTRLREQLAPGRGSIQGVQIEHTRLTLGKARRGHRAGRHVGEATVQVSIRPGFYFDKEELDMDTSLAGKEHGCQDLVILIDDLEAFADRQLGGRKSEGHEDPGAGEGRRDKDQSPFLLCGVLDGHGQHGQTLVDWVKNVLPVILARERKLLSDPPHALTQAFLKCQQGLARVSQCGVDATYSGTTASVALVRDGAIYCANVGDSRGVLVRRDPETGRVSSMDLTKDHTLSDSSERNLIQASGNAQVRQLVLDDPQGINPPMAVGPHRIFEGSSHLPGLAMSRSLGDLTAHALGVTAQPSIFEHVVQDEDLLLVLATDGLWEYFSSDEVAQWCCDYLERNDGMPPECEPVGKAAARGSGGVAEGMAAALSREAQVRWMQDEDEAGLISIDDTGIVIVLLKQEWRDALGPPTACRAGDNERAPWRPRKSETVASISASIYAYLVKQRDTGEEAACRPADDPLTHSPRGHV